MTKADKDRWRVLMDRMRTELATERWPQGPFVHLSNPGGKGDSVSYVFQEKVCLGVREAIAYAEELLQKGPQA